MSKKFYIKTLKEFINESRKITRYSLGGKYMSDMVKDEDGPFVLYKDAGRPKNVIRMAPIGNGQMIKTPNGDWISYNSIKEDYTSSLGLKKNKWEEINPQKHPDELAREFFKLIDIAYKPIGGHIKVNSPKDVFKDPKWNYWKIVDVDDDPDADVVIFGNKGKYGIKTSGVGHDGGKQAKKAYLDDKGKEFNKKGFYGEVSKKFAVNKSNGMENIHLIPICPVMDGIVVKLEDKTMLK